MVSASTMWSPHATANHCRILQPERLRIDLLRSAELYHPTKGCKALVDTKLKVTEVCIPLNQA
jgi:hypothetical protein